MTATRAALMALVVALGSRPALADGNADAADGHAGPEVGRDAGLADGDAGGVQATDGRARDDGAGVTPPAVGALALVPLHGCVLEAGTRRPLAGASIAIDAVSADVTGDDGCFTSRVRPGPHRIQVQALDHQSTNLRVDAAPGTGATFVARMGQQQTGERYQTTVVAGHEEVPHVGVTGDEARRTPGASGDPLRVLGSLPGVSQVVWPAAIYVVRGANPGNTGFFLDGIKIPALFHLALGPSIIHPYFIEALEFYPGTYPPSYGGFVAGIVAARTAPTPTDRVHASADVTVFDAGGLVTAPWDDQRGTVALAARYSYTGALLSLLETDTTLRYGDYQARLDHRLGSGRATVFAFGSLDDIGWKDPTLETHQYGALQFHRLDARWVGPLGPGRLLAAATGGADWAHSTLFSIPIQVRALSAAPRLRYDVTGRLLELSVGADLQAQTFATEVPPFQGQQSDLGRSRRALTQGTFAALTIHAGSRLIISPGVRADVFAEEGYAAPRVRASPRSIGARHRRVRLQGQRGPLRPDAEPPGERGRLRIVRASQPGAADLAGRLARGRGAHPRRADAVGDRLLSTAAVDRHPQHRDCLDGSGVAGLPGGPERRELRRRGARAARRPGAPVRLAGLHAVVEPARGRQRRSRNVRLGPAPHPERRGGLPAARRLLGRRPRALSHRAAGPHLQQRWRIRAAAGLLPARSARRSRRFVFDRFIMDVFVDFANATLTREIIQVTRPVPEGPSQSQPPDLQQGFRIILPTVGVHGEF